MIAMKILVLEDRAAVALPMSEALEELGHTILPAYNINDAKSIWEKWDVDSLILDSNMSAWGLKEDEIASTKMGLLTGWIWLKNYVFATKPIMRKRTIILSEYLSEIKQYVPPEDLVGIFLVPKKGPSSSAERVLECLKTIEASLKE